MRLYWHDIKNYYVDLIFSIKVFEVTEAEYAIVERIRCISFEGEGVLEQALSLICYFQYALPLKTDATNPFNDSIFDLK